MLVINRTMLIWTARLLCIASLPLLDRLWRRYELESAMNAFVVARRIEYNSRFKWASETTFGIFYIFSSALSQTVSFTFENVFSSTFGFIYSYLFDKIFNITLVNIFIFDLGASTTLGRAFNYMFGKMNISEFIYVVLSTLLNMSRITFYYIYYYTVGNIYNLFRSSYPGKV